MLRYRHACATLLLGGLLVLQPARAETFNTCAGFIDSVPATITTQGVWCLRQDLATNIASGNAITIATNNVTIDCNGFKLGGLAAGNGSSAYGIQADNRQNATVRHCNVRGFYYGIRLVGGAGHMVEDNRLDNNLQVGIYISGDNNLVLRNRVYDTGGRTGITGAYGISASADIIDNTVSGLFADISGGTLYGIQANASGTQVRGNTVSGFDGVAAQGGVISGTLGIHLANSQIRASDNHVAGNASVGGYGILGSYNSDTCINNSVSGFTANIYTCTSMGNLTTP